MLQPVETSPHTGGQPVKRVVYSEEVIARRVGEMGREIAAAYPPDQDLLVLGLLKGSFMFLADLVRQIPRPLQLDFLVVASYGSGKVSSGDVRLVYDPEAALEDRHVLLVEDIVDSGKTISRIVPILEERGPSSLEIVALLDKGIATDLYREPKWVGFDAPPEFLIGYGLDYSENFRNLPYVASI